MNYYVTSRRWIKAISNRCANLEYEFALFTLGSRRIVVRGDSRALDIKDLLPKLRSEGWRWSAHTHPGTRDIVLNASGKFGDRDVLRALD